MEQILEKLMDIIATQNQILVTQRNQQKTLEDHTKILEKQEETLLRNTITVEDHHRRSLALEAEINEVRASMQPALDHVRNTEALGKGIRWLGWIAGSIATASALVYGIIEFFTKG